MRWRPVSGGPRRRLRGTGLALLAVVATIAGAYLLVPLAVRLFVQALSLLLRGSLWLATSFGRGDDSWTVAAAVGRGVTTALVTPSALGVVGGLLLLGAVALFGLQRLLESEEHEESSR